MLVQLFSVASAGGEYIQTSLPTSNAPNDWKEFGESLFIWHLVLRECAEHRAVV